MRCLEEPTGTDGRWSEMNNPNGNVYHFLSAMEIVIVVFDDIPMMKEIQHQNSNLLRRCMTHGRYTANILAWLRAYLSTWIDLHEQSRLLLSLAPRYRRCILCQQLRGDIPSKFFHLVGSLGNHDGDQWAGNGACYRVQSRRQSERHRLTLHPRGQVLHAEAGVEQQSCMPIRTSNSYRRRGQGAGLSWYS